MFEANCSRQMGQHKETIFHQMFLCLHDDDENDNKNCNKNNITITGYFNLSCRLKTYYKAGRVNSKICNNTLVE